MTDGIKEITNANYSKRLNLGNEPEFKEIATLFNEMAERLAEYRNSSLEDILQGKKYIETIINSIAEPIIGLSKERKILFVNDEAFDCFEFDTGKHYRQTGSRSGVKK